MLKIIYIILIEIFINLIIRSTFISMILTSNIITNVEFYKIFIDITTRNFI